MDPGEVNTDGPPPGWTLMEVYVRQADVDAVWESLNMSGILAYCDSIQVWDDIEEGLVER